MSKKNYSNMYNKSKNEDRPVAKPSFNKEPEKVFEAPKPVETVPVIQNGSEPIVEPKPVPQSQPQSAPQAKPSSFRAEVVDCNKLNVREEPSTEASIVDVLNAGFKVTVYPEQAKGAFCKVTYASGKEGYCMKKFLKKIVK